MHKQNEVQMVASKQMLKIFQKHLLYRKLEFRYSLVNDIKWAEYGR